MLSCSGERDHIDHLIAQVECDSEILALRRQRNATAPISSLPSDLLLDIFLCCRDQCRLYSYLWISQVSHTCQSWRELALSSGTLWSKINFWKLKAAVKMLLRSGTAPLDIVLNNGSWTESLALVGQILASEAHRMAHLELSLSWNILPELLAQAKKPAPHLLSLCLSSCYAKMTIPDDIFAGKMPNLRELTLINCHFQGLVHLCALGLHKLCVVETDIPSITDLHDALRSMPHLKIIRIDNAFQKSSPLELSPNPVYLPQLCELCVVDTSRRLARIIAPLRDCFLDLHAPNICTLECTDTDIDIIDSEVPYIYGWMISNTSTPLTGVAINGRGCSIRCYTHHVPPETYRDHLPPVELRLCEIPSGMAWPFIAYCMANTPFMSVEHLLVSGGRDFVPAHEWPNVFAHALHGAGARLCARRNSRTCKHGERLAATPSVHHSAIRILPLRRYGSVLSIPTGPAASRRERTCQSTRQRSKRPLKAQREVPES